MRAEPRSYRRDRDVPDFDDAAPLIIFDGDCALCSAGVQAMVRLGPDSNARFAPIRSRLAAALYRHYGLDPDRFDTFMVLTKGRPFLRWSGVLAAARTLPPPWSWLGSAGRLVPDFVGDRLYDFVQRNRIGWFGRARVCVAADPRLAPRILEDAPATAA